MGGLESVTYQNSPTNFALVASGGAAGDGNYVVSESQAYGLLITGTILARGTRTAQAASRTVPKY